MEKTLVIHPSDSSTDFLKPIYSGLENAVVLTGGLTKEEVREAIEKSDRIIMLGHGSPFGLFSVGRFQSTNGYIIDNTMVDVLSNTGPFTVFAPVNAAFDKLPAGTVPVVIPLAQFKSWLSDAGNRRDQFIEHASTVDELRRRHGMTAENTVTKVKAQLNDTAARTTKLIEAA